MLPKNSQVSVLVLGVFLVGAAAAADMPNQDNTRGRLKAGGFDIRPKLTLALGKNNNVGLSSGARTVAKFTSLRPRVVIALPTRGQLYSLKYAGEYTRFSGSSRDNFNNHAIGLVADNIWLSRLTSLLNFDYVKGHDGRNALRFQFLERWHTTGLKGRLHYGAEGAQGQIELAAGLSSKRYDTNNSGNTTYYNHDTVNLTGTFFFKVAPATQMFVEAGTAKFTYSDPVAKNIDGLDSTQRHLMLGVKWKATAKTTGSFKLGKMRKSFNLAVKPSGSGTVWAGNITWSPRTYSHLTATLNQNAQEYGGAGSFMISRDSNLAWTHDWSAYVSSALTLGEGEDKFQNSNRIFKRQKYGAKLTYGVNRWLNAGISYDYSKRNAINWSVLSYTQSVVMLTLEGTL